MEITDRRSFNRLVIKKYVMISPSFMHTACNMTGERGGWGAFEEVAE